MPAALKASLASGFIFPDWQSGWTDWAGGLDGQPLFLQPHPISLIANLER